MKLDVGPGGITIDAHDLAPLLVVEPAQVPGLMRTGKITSLYEKGEEADAGRFRVTFRYVNMKIRFTCDADGTVLSQTRIRGAAAGNPQG